MSRTSDILAIAFASQQANPAEGKYTTTELEVAALIFSVKYFEVYLLVNQFVIGFEKTRPPHNDKYLEIRILII